MMLTFVQVMNASKYHGMCPFRFPHQEASRVLKNQTPTSGFDLTTSFCDIAFVELGGKAGSSGPFHCALQWAQYSHDDVLSHVAQTLGIRYQMNGATNRGFKVST
jgi:hypothetical protein